MKNPTEKQKKLARAIIENVKELKGKPLGILMKEVGYSVAQSKNPAQIVRSNSFQNLMAKSGVSQDELAKAWRELLRAEVESKPMSWTEKIAVAKNMSKLFGLEPESSTPTGPNAVFFSKIAALQATPEDIERQRVEYEEISRARLEKERLNQDQDKEKEENQED